MTVVHRGVHKYTFHQPQNTNSLRDTGNNTTHTVFQGELAVELHANDVEVGTSSDRNHRPCGHVCPLKSSWGGHTVLDLVTTKAFVFGGFSIMHQ